MLKPGKCSLSTIGNGPVDFKIDAQCAVTAAVEARIAQRAEGHGIPIALIARGVDQVRTKFSHQGDGANSGVDSKPLPHTSALAAQSQRFELT